MPKDIETTLYGEYSLRQKYDNYFMLSRNDIGIRKREPHNIEIRFKFQNKDYVEEIKFDTLDTYLSNINTKLGKEIVTNDTPSIRLQDWIELNNEG